MCVPFAKRNDDPHGAAQSFSADRDGFVLGGGVGMPLLEPLESAHVRGAHVYAEVCGYGQVVGTHHVTASSADGSCAAKAITPTMREVGAGADSRVRLDVRIRSRYSMPSYARSFRGPSK